MPQRVTALLHRRQYDATMGFERIRHTLKCLPVMPHYKQHGVRSSLPALRSVAQRMSAPLHRRSHDLGGGLQLSVHVMH